MQTYETRGRVFRAREGTIQVPPHLLDVVIGVFGFDQRPQAVPHFRIKRSGAPGGAAPRAVGGPSFNPTDLADLYQFPAGVNGAGETIGIIELGGGYTPDDLQTYFAQLGINPAPSVTSVSVDGGQNQPGDPTGADGEVELDIEVAGDNGSTDGQSDGQNHVDFPASSPYVAGCGGTTLQTSGGQITSETVWNELASGNGATGGGVSAVFPLPGYQQNAGDDGSGEPDRPTDPCGLS
jgi:subtilase family serine protease